jgi:hypothetical protein
MGNPTVTPLVEALHDGGFIVSMANGHRSFDPITLLSGVGKVLAGTVLGQATTGLTASSAALGTNTGNGVMGAVTLVTVPTQIGVYSLVYTDATHFTVTAPDGATAAGINGTPFSALGIGFTMTTGATPMVAGDGFTITTTQKVGNPSAASVANGGNTGNSTSSAVTCTGYAPMLGDYKVSIVEPGANVGTFLVEDPSGKEIGHGAVAAAFSAGGISFTLADGATDFVSGDQFVITVAAGTGKWKPWDPANVDGSQVVAGVLYGYRDATSADKAAVAVTRAAEVNASELIWPTGANAAVIAAGVAGLKSIGILAR